MYADLRAKNVKVNEIQTQPASTAEMHRQNNAVSQHLTHYRRILLRMEDNSGKTIIEKGRPRTSTQEVQAAIQPLLPLKTSIKCMLKQLLQHCKRYNLLLDFQSAYRKTIQQRPAL